MNLVEGLLAEIERCQEIHGHCLEIGAPGRFLALMLGRSIDQAEAALASGDVVAMVQSLKDLQGFKE